MNEPISGVVLRHDGRSHDITELTQFGFTVPGGMEGVDLTAANSATLTLGTGEDFDIEFRVRRGAPTEGMPAEFRFWKPSLRVKDQIRKLNDQRKLATSANATLVSSSYDDLAAGLLTSETAQEGSAKTAATAGEKSATTGQSGGVKSLAAILLLFGMFAVIVLAFAFLRSRNSLDVSHSALVGNFVPVNARVAGEVTEVFFADGSEVEKGDVLMRLSNPDLEFDHQHLAAQRDAAAAKCAALDEELEGYRKKLLIAAEKLDLDMKAAKSRLAHARKLEAMFTSAVQRIQPGLRSGSVTQLEYDEIDSQLAAAVAAGDAEEAEMQSIGLARSAISSEVLILGNRVNDEMGRIRSDLASAKAEYEQFKTLAELSARQASQLEILAPRSGRVHACYRQKGEFLKVADEAMAISYPGRVWASGQVSASQASRVLPGQKVTVTVPSMHLRLDGIVSAVGHRGVYSKGNYSADFRGEVATDVPIKVQLVDVPNGVPSGIRMDMSITTGFGVKWIDDLMGNSPATETVDKKDEPLLPPDQDPAKAGEEAIVKNAAPTSTVGQSAAVSLAAAVQLPANEERVDDR